MTSFLIQSLPAGEADAGAPTGRLVVAEGPSPCRRCLRNARVGDPLVLLSYDPFTQESPYAGEGPIYVHADGCQPHRPAPDEVCEQVHGRLLSVRAYDSDAMMVDSEVMAGEQLAAQAPELLKDGTAFLHVHFAGPGCFGFRIDRATDR